LHAALLTKAKKYTQKELQGIIKEPQPRISEFLSGKIASVSFEKMPVYAFRLGTKPSIKLEAVQKQGTRLPGRMSKGKSPVAPKTKRLASVVWGRRRVQSLPALLNFGRGVQEAQVILSSATSPSHRR